MIEPPEHIPEEERAKDLLRRRAWPARPVVGEETLRRVDQRSARRPVGCSRRTWLRVAGADPFELPESSTLTRRTTYVDGRFIRIDQADKDARRAPGAQPTPPSSWNHKGGGDDARAGNVGEALIPVGFRNLPPAQPKENQGESLIPAGFRDIPVAKPPSYTPPTPPPRPSPQPAPPPARPTSSTGRMMVAPDRRRVPIQPGGAASRPPAPPEASIGPPPQAPPKAPPAAPTPSEIPQKAAPPVPARAPSAHQVASPPAPQPSAAPPVEPLTPPNRPASTGQGAGLDELFGPPLDGRARISRRPALAAPVVVPQAPPAPPPTDTSGQDGGG